MPAVTIYERVKQQGKWSEVSVTMPRINKKDGSIFLKDDRQRTVHRHLVRAQEEEAAGGQGTTGAAAVPIRGSQARRLEEVVSGEQGRPPCSRPHNGKVETRDTQVRGPLP